MTPVRLRERRGIVCLPTVAALLANTEIGLPRQDNGTHSLRRTKAALVYKRTGNQILLGHTKIDTTVRYLGVDVEDALSKGSNVGDCRPMSGNSRVGFLDCRLRNLLCRERPRSGSDTCGKEPMARSNQALAN